MQILGLILILWFLVPWRRQHRIDTTEPSPLVSIIIPARNEAANLPALLESLRRLIYPASEILVVDDHSTDATAEVARSYGARVISAPERPPNWSGKNWACWNGYLHAGGDLLLFTDADTAHRPHGLRLAVNHLVAGNYGLISAPPYHRTERLWEKSLGLFHLLLLAATAVYRKPTPSRHFSIGQFLLFKRDAYETIGGHKGIAAELLDDLRLSTKIQRAGFDYGVFYAEPLYEVRMYPTFRDFITGWRRNFRLGLGFSGALSVIETVLIVSAAAAPVTLAGLASWAVLAWRQSRIGSFPWWSFVMFPFALAVFVLVTLLALYDEIRGNKLQWRGRDYISR